MKLLSSALSPYAARVGLAIYARNLPVEIAGVTRTLIPMI